MAFQSTHYVPHSRLSHYRGAGEKTQELMNDNKEADTANLMLRLRLIYLCHRNGGVVVPVKINNVKGKAAGRK